MVFVLLLVWWREEIINIMTMVFKCNLWDFRDGLYINICEKSVNINGIWTLWGIIINYVESSYQNKLNGLSGWYNSPGSEFTLGVLLIRGVISSVKGSSSSVLGTICTCDFLPVVLFIWEIVVHIERQMLTGLLMFQIWIWIRAEYSCYQWSGGSWSWAFFSSFCCCIFSLLC